MALSALLIVNCFVLSAKLTNMSVCEGLCYTNFMKMRSIISDTVPSLNHENKLDFTINKIIRPLLTDDVRWARCSRNHVLILFYLLQCWRLINSWDIRSHGRFLWKMLSKANTCRILKLGVPIFRKIISRCPIWKLIRDGRWRKSMRSDSQCCADLVH